MSSFFLLIVSACIDVPFARTCVRVIAMKGFYNNIIIIMMMTPLAQPLCIIDLKKYYIEFLFHYNYCKNSNKVQSR